MKSLRLVLIPVIASAGVFAGDLTRSFGQSFTTNLLPAEDTYVRETLPDNNFGTSPVILVGVSNFTSPTNHAFFKFDLSGIPTNATVTAATFRLIVVQDNRPPALYGLHRVLVNWAEAEATWNHRVTSTPWAIGGALAGTDFDSAPSVIAPLDNTGSTNAFTSAGVVGDVQAWVNNPASNFGWIFIADGELPGSGKQVGSRDIPDKEPVLTVSYTLPQAPQPPVLTVLPPTNGYFQFSFIAEGNTGYQVQFNSDLSDTNWTTCLVIAPIAGPSYVTNVTDIDPLTSSNRFFRVKNL